MVSYPAMSRLVRFVPKPNPSRILMRQPLQNNLDISVAVREGANVTMNVFSGTSVLSPGAATSEVETIGRILSPLAQYEVGTIRCIGLNATLPMSRHEIMGRYVDLVPVFHQERLRVPTPATAILPKPMQLDDCGDYESDIAVIIGKTANKRPVDFSTSVIPDPSKLWLRRRKNSKVLQDCSFSDLIFSIPKIAGFLSQSITLPAGNIIITGTLAGAGMRRTPKETLRERDEFAVEILPHIGSLFNVFKNG
ncbi:hypothetical protein ACJZ2D_012844 [Fusarium nematophilum]